MKKVKAKVRKKKQPVEENYFQKVQRLNQELLDNIKKNLPDLKKLLKKINSDDYYGDGVYRFYHESFKVYWVQSATEKMVGVLKKLAPAEVTEFNDMFEQIFKEGTGKKFKSKDNARWMKVTRPMLEAFFHAKYFLEMAVKFGKELDKAPECLPSGWAGLLYLFNLR